MELDCHLGHSLQNLSHANATCPKWAFNSPLKAQTFWFTCLQIPFVYCDNVIIFELFPRWHEMYQRFWLPFCIRLGLSGWKRCLGFHFDLEAPLHSYATHLDDFSLVASFSIVSTHIWPRPMGCNSSIDLLVYYPYFLGILRWPTLAISCLKWTIFYYST
jgi:hypothetical protein